MLLKFSLTFLLVTAVAYMSYAFMRRDSTPSQPYKVVRKMGALEIRFYPSAVIASVHKSGDYRDNLNAGFRDLASYIFGGNDQNEKIAMTTPVVSIPDSTGDEIQFVMPENFDMNQRPAPTKAPHIQFQETEPVYTAALTFGGFARKHKMEQKSAELLEALKSKGLEPAGPVRHLYYNAPFDLFGRRNEVMVDLKGFSE